MEYIPYRITAGSHKIKVYQNESRGLKTFTSLEDGKEFLKSEALEVVKYEESGKNAENCVYSTETVLNNVHSVKNGLFIEEQEDGFALKDKKYESYISWTPTITEKEYYILASLVRPTSCPPKRETTVKSKDNNTKISGHNEVIAQLKSALQEGIQLKSTGLLENLVNPVVVEEEMPSENDEEVFIESYEDSDYSYSSEACLIDLPLIPDLPSLPELMIPMNVQSVEPILARASFVEDLNKAIQGLDQELIDIAEQHNLLDRAFEELNRSTTLSQYAYERIPSEESPNSHNSESEESETYESESEESETSESESEEYETSESESEESETSESFPFEEYDEENNMDFCYENSEDEFRRYSV